MANISPPSTACHNCRRQRSRCDRSLPGCHKCSRRGEQCPGYGRLLRWTNAVAVRGKLADHTHIVRLALADPLVVDLGPRHRTYVSHFARSVCPDLVALDHQDARNPFRSMLSLSGSFGYIREITLATAAVHMVTLRRSRGQPYREELVDALAAKGRAYRLLRRALDGLPAADRPVAMIAAVFFVNFDLIESGRGSWKAHVEAAGNLLKSIHAGVNSGAQGAAGVAQLADVVVADCITYHVLGSAFASGPRGTAGALSAFESIDMASALQRAAAFSYGCYPPVMLEILSRASRLSLQDTDGARALIQQLRGLDCRAWVYSIEGLSPNDDLETRVAVASAHRAATCLYIILAVSDLESEAHAGPALRAETQAREVLAHLASVPIEHTLAKGLIWPTFMAGAQTDDPAGRQWCLGRMQRIWESSPWVCPWGYIESAMTVMRRVWETRDATCKAARHLAGMNWLQQLKATSDHVLIV